MDEIMQAYISLLEALISEDHDGAAFALELAAEVEEKNRAEVREARALLPVDVSLLLEERSLQREMARVQAALRALD